MNTHTTMGPVAVFSHFKHSRPLTNFMKFWKVMNDFQASQGLPHLLYGDARAWFEQSGLEESK